jgi:hypothetical protein
MNPRGVFSKFSPNEFRWSGLRVVVCSKRMFAGLPCSGENRQPAASSSLLILMRAVASLMFSGPFACAYLHDGATRVASMPSPLPLVGNRLSITLISP